MTASPSRSGRGAPTLATVLGGVALASSAMGLVFAFPAAARVGFGSLYATDLMVAVSFGTIGLLVARRRQDNPIGWLFLGIGVLEGMSVALNHYAIVGLSADPFLPGSVWAGWLAYWLVTLVVPSGLFLSLLTRFPTGRPLSRGWARVERAGLTFSVLFAMSEILFLPTMEIATGLPEIDNPTNVATSQVPDTAWLIGLAILATGVVGLVVRFRRARGEERQQLRWFVAAVAASIGALVAFTLAFFAVGAPDPEPTWFVVTLNIITIGGIGIGIPAACGVAVLRYRLWDLDVVIRKAVLYASLAVGATLVYLAVVVGAGAWLGRDSSFLTMVAAVVVAVTFQPARQRVTHLANRFVYGTRATPYELLSEFSERVGDTYASMDLLPRMATVLAEGTGASRTDIWLKVGDELRPAATWPSDAAPADPLRLSNGDVPTLPHADVAYPVRHQGELLGALGLSKPPSDPLTPTDQRLVSDLAGQAGLVLRNARLTTELETRIEELRALQKRLVSAQDEERRRLERNIHDGAQQQLVALTVKARLVRGFAEKDAAKAAELASQLEIESRDALENLRDLARGIYPPLLADKGLVAALESQARKSAVPVRLSADEIGRYPQEVEAAAYFCVLEALQNVSKYAQATNATVRLARENGHLVFEIVDDGVGFDPTAGRTGTGVQGMADRVAALDGALEVRSAPGAGAIVSGRIPVPGVGA
ncbi:MAG: histidine kinase [Actinomycetota bacterium]